MHPDASRKSIQRRNIPIFAKLNLPSLLTIGICEEWTKTESVRNMVEGLTHVRGRCRTTETNRKMERAIERTDLQGWSCAPQHPINPMYTYMMRCSVTQGIGSSTCNCSWDLCNTPHIRFASPRARGGYSLVYAYLV